MKTIIKSLLLLLVVGLVSCESDYGMFNRDNRPDIPLQFVNTTSYGFDPFIEVSMSDPEGVIEFIMEIPEGSGRSISEITRVAAGATAINPGTLNTAGDYITESIPGEGNRVVFTTSLEEFAERRPAVWEDAAPGGELAFLFLVTLDNGETIVSMRARVELTE